MFSTALMTICAAIVLLLGSIHLLYTFAGNRLAPRDATLVAHMAAVHPVLTRETTIWKAWVGFNASHSMGAMLFGLVYGYLALVQGAMLFASAYLLTLGFLMLAGLTVLAKRYWFRIPLVGCSVALACYVAAVAGAVVR